MTSPRLLDLLFTIDEIKKQYSFMAKDTFITLDQEELSRKPRIELRTLTDEGYDVRISKVIENANN